MSILGFPAGVRGRYRPSFYPLLHAIQGLVDIPHGVSDAKAQIAFPIGPKCRARQSGHTLLPLNSSTRKQARRKAICGGVPCWSGTARSSLVHRGLYVREKGADLNENSYEAFT